MQWQIKINGTLAPCPGPSCSRQPKHYEWRHKHALECSPCGVSTPWFDTFQEAVAYWERHETTAIRSKLQ